MPEIVPYGTAALLVRGDDLDPAGWARRVTALDLAEVVDVVPGAATLLVDTTGPDAVASVRARLDEVLVAPDVERNPNDERRVEIAVRFDGPDLEEVAHRCRVETAEVVRRIVESPLRVAFCGFAPGFAYLDGLHRSLDLPRRDTPRTRVPPGSFAIAAGYAAVYPTASPGGWHLIGSTDAEVWDVARDEPALLTPGARVIITVRPGP